MRTGSRPAAGGSGRRAEPPGAAGHPAATPAPSTALAGGAHRDTDHPRRDRRRRRQVIRAVDADPGRGGPVARALVRLVVRMADTVTRLLGVSASAGRESITEAQLRDLVAANVVLDGEERRLIAEVLAAAARHVREVMVPRTDVVFLDAALPLRQAVATARAAPHSRFPVIDGSHDDVVGFVHLRDLLIHPDSDGSVTVGGLAREVKRLPGSKRVLAALSEMRRERHHLAVVVDEYGGTAGIVTLEDLIEELVGEITDEYDPAPDPTPPDGSSPAEVDGRLNLVDFAERTGLALPAGPYETVGGFLMARLGRVPALGDEVRVGRIRLVVAALEGRRVARVALRSPVPEARGE